MARATSSSRRAAWVRSYSPGFKVTDLRRRIGYVIQSTDRYGLTATFNVVFELETVLYYRGVPVAWQLTRGGKIVPVAAPAPVYLTDYDPATGHNNADVFVSWLRANGLADGQAPANDTLNSLAAGDAPATLYAAGHPLSDPFWVVVAVDGQPRTVLVQVFERWTLTYTPGNPAGWQVELGNVGRHYYEWRYEQESLDALLGIANPDEPTRRRRHRGRLLKGKLPGDGGI